MIYIRKSPTADTRTCDFANTSKETLLASSHQHIYDVRQGLAFFVDRLVGASAMHDFDKISDIDGFHRDFLTGFAQTTWWDNHRKVNRHHLIEDDGVPQDVNLIDVLDMIADCVCAGMARSGSVYPLAIKPEVLMTAFQNTVALLKSQVEVIDGAAPTEPKAILRHSHRKGAMNTQITLGWKTILGKHYICMAVVPSNGEMIQFTCDEPYTDLEEVKRVIDSLAEKMFPDRAIEPAPNRPRVTIN